MSLTEEESDWVKTLPEAKGFVDVHCHLIAEEFDEDRDHIINEAITEGVKAIVVVAEGDDLWGLWTCIVILLLKNSMRIVTISSMKLLQKALKLL